jgi:hypothetical protein
MSALGTAVGFLVLVTVCVLGCCASAASGAEPQKVRDRMWVWAHDAGVYNGQWNLPGRSSITPVEGAAYLGLANVIFIRYEGKPQPPFSDYARPFRSLRKVMWSVTGAGGATSDAERREVLALAREMPNLTGVFMDDFFQFTAAARGAAGGEAGAAAALSVEQLEQLRRQLTLDSRRLDLGVTLYTHQLDPRIAAHLALCDVVSLWMWKADDLERLQSNFALFEKLAPRKRTLLGLYMWDFGTGRPMPLERMKKQCHQALQWLREGRIEGMIFLATNLCDLKLETVGWTKGWIAEVGDGPLGQPPR